jgi:hypothetical protein
MPYSSLHLNRSVQGDPDSHHLHHISMSCICNAHSYTEDHKTRHFCQHYYLSPFTVSNIPYALKNISQNMCKTENFKELLILKS